MILCLETATSLCSVALCDRNGVVDMRESDEGRSHASKLTVFAAELLESAGIKAGELEALVVSKGPGSYTGLRIGVSAAKGIAYAASVPVVGVNTTLSMYYGFLPVSEKIHGLQSTDLFCPALDARRMEIYYSIFGPDGKIFRDIRAEIIDTDSFSDIPLSSRIFFFGDGAPKIKELIKRKNCVFDESFRMSASYMLRPAYEAIDRNLFEDVAYFEPFYLKDFLTSNPVKNIL